MENVFQEVDVAQECQSPVLDPWK